VDLLPACVEVISLFFFFFLFFLFFLFFPVWIFDNSKHPHPQSTTFIFVVGSGSSHHTSMPKAH